MSKLLCILLAALMLGGCVRSEVREARRERPPLREVFPPPSLEQASPAPAAEPDAGVAVADAPPAAPDAEPAAQQGGAALTLDSPPPAPALADEFAEARPAVEEAQQAAAETAAADVAAAAAAEAVLAEADDDVVEDDGAVPATEPPLAGITDQVPADRPEDVASAQGSAAGATEALVQALPESDTRTPPRIIVSTRPAILVPVYGKPRMVNVAGTALTRIENTPAVVLKGKSGNYYIPVYDGFMHSKKLDGNWIVTKPIPKVLFKGKAEALKAGQQDLFAARPDPRTGRTPTFELGAPRVIVSSQPTALVLVDGQPGFQSVPGTELSRLVNSESVMFRHDVDGQLYLQVGERWYRAASTNGPWRSVSDAQLPAGIAVALQAAR